MDCTPLVTIGAAIGHRDLTARAAGAVGSAEAESHRRRVGGRGLVVAPWTLLEVLPPEDPLLVVVAAVETAPPLPPPPPTDWAKTP